MLNRNTSTTLLSQTLKIDENLNYRKLGYTILIVYIVQCTSSQELSPIEKADKKKAEGNNNFKKSHYNEALECYKQAVVLYPSNKYIKMS